MNFLRVMAVGVLLLCFPSWCGLLAGSLNSVSQKNEKQNAIIFGAAVRSNSWPTEVLELRLNKGVELYKQQIVDKILVSGDNRSPEYNEPLVMKTFLQNNGVPVESIVEDFGGRSTRDTCWRAYHVFGIRKAIIITQHFHISRAFSLCTAQGIEVDIAPVLSSSVTVSIWGIMRDIFATPANVLQLVIGYTPSVKKDGTETQFDISE